MIGAWERVLPDDTSEKFLLKMNFQVNINLKIYPNYGGIYSFKRKLGNISAKG